MDYDADIEARRRDIEARYRPQEQSTLENAARLRQQELELAQFNDLGKKFVQWAKQSDTAPTRYKSVPISGAKPVQVGRGRNKHTVIQTRQVGVWVFWEKSEVVEHGWGVTYKTVGEIAIHEDGEISWTVGARTPAALWDYIANFIVRSGSSVRWPG